MLEVNESFHTLPNMFNVYIVTPISTFLTVVTLVHAAHSIVGNDHRLGPHYAFGAWLFCISDMTRVICDVLCRTFKQCLDCRRSVNPHLQTIWYDSVQHRHIDTSYNCKSNTPLSVCGPVVLGYPCVVSPSIYSALLYLAWRCDDTFDWSSH